MSTYEEIDMKLVAKLLKTESKLLKGMGFCNQCQKPWQKGICSCGKFELMKEKNKERMEKFANIMKKYREIRSEYFKLAEEKGFCEQCKFPHYDGICECGHFNDKEVENMCGICYMLDL